MSTRQKTSGATPSSKLCKPGQPDSRGGTLFVVATPIGNLGDITYRAVEVLNAASTVLAEDTRRSRKLFVHHGINTELVALHEHNEQAMVERVLGWLRQGHSLALISDAGTPLISDPGYVLTNQVLAAGLRVVPVPGPSAVVSALSAGGLPTHRFAFEGFLPAKDSARTKAMEGWRGEERTIAYYESAHRILRSLESLSAVLGADRQVTVARELTKVFETFYRGTVDDVLAMLRSSPNAQKGEFVVLVAGEPAGEDRADNLAVDRLLGALLEELSVSQAVRVAHAATGERKNTLYARAVALDQQRTSDRE